MSLEGSGLILLTRISMLKFLASAYVLILLSSGGVLVFLTVFFVGVLKLIWYILIVECISKVPVDNGFNHLMVWVNVNVIYI